MKMLRGERKQIDAVECAKFCNVAAAVIGGSVASAAIGASASHSAAQTQADAANQATQLQQQMYDTTAANVRPWLDAGKSTLANLMSGVNSGAYTPTSYGSATPLTGMTAESIQGASSLGPSLKSVYQPTAGNLAGFQNPNPNSLSQFGSVGPMATVAPAASLKAYQDYVAQNPYQGPGTFTADKFKQDPGYQFQLNEGTAALENASSISGGMNSNNLKGLMKFAEGLAGTTYNDAFNRYQTEANRSLGEYQTNLQDYMQQFQLGQNVTSLNNQNVTQGLQNEVTQAGFNNQVTQQQYEDMMRTTAANNQVSQQDLLNSWEASKLNNASSTQSLENMIAATGFNNQTAQQAFGNTGAIIGTNNQVTSANDANSLQRQQLNNASLQQIFSNLMSLSGEGMGAALQQGQIGANFANSAAQNIMSAGAAQAAGTMGAANAITGGISNGYNMWMQQQMMNQMFPPVANDAMAFGPAMMTA